MYNEFGNTGDIALWEAEIGIEKKKLTARSKGCWSREIKAAIQARKVSCSREARSDVGDECLLQQWEEYKSVRRHVKMLIRLEKKSLRKN